MGNGTSILPVDLYARIGTASAPILLDVRRTASFDADETLIASALRRDPEQVGAWQRAIPRNCPVVVYCVHGQEVSQRVAAALRACDVDARYLEGGITGWAELGLPRRQKAPASPHGWITRERPKIDRIACPWLMVK
jgi:rhodanese-related sulfurtransferase